MPRNRPNYRQERMAQARQDLAAVTQIRRQLTDSGPRGAGIRGHLGGSDATANVKAGTEG
jgi:hypothetical protein